MLRRIYTLIIALVILLIGCGATPAQHDKLGLTAEEKVFIINHPIVTIGVDPGFIPFQFVDENGQHTGIAADYLKLISEMTGITFEMVSNLSWPETYEKAVNGEIDMLSAVAKTVEREQVFNFSQTYYRFRRVIVVHSDEKEIKDLNDLREKTVAVQRNSSHHSYLNNFVNINLSLYDTVEEALTAVSVKSERAFVGNLATTDYLITIYP